MGLKRAMAKTNKVWHSRGVAEIGLAAGRGADLRVGHVWHERLRASSPEGIASQLCMTRTALYYADGKQDLLEKRHAWTHARYRDASRRNLGKVAVVNF